MRTLNSIASLLLMILCASATHAQSANERLLEDGRYKELVAKLKSSSVDDLESRLLLSQAHEGLEDFDAAIRVAKASTKSHPTMATAHLRLAEALRAKMSRSGKIKAMMILGDYKKAFRKARELDPNNLSAREEQIGFLTQAPGVAGGDKKKAAELIAELKRMDLTRGSRLEARLLQGAGEDEKAVALLEKALLAAPEDEPLRTQTAMALQRAERFAEADKVFAPLLESENQDRVMSTRYQMARSRVVGKYETQVAIEEFQSYIKDLKEPRPGLPGRDSAHWRMGLAYEQLGNRAGAETAYRAALTENPKHKPAKEALKALR